MIKELRFETSKGKFFMVENTPEVLRQVPHDFCDRIGLLSVLTEGQAREILDQSIHTGLFAHYVDNVPVNTYCYKDWRDSLHSLIKSKGWYLENPEGEEPRSYSEVIDGVSATEIMEDLESWQEAESRTFRNPVIFKIK